MLFGLVCVLFYIDLFNLLIILVSIFEEWNFSVKEYVMCRFVNWHSFTDFLCVYVNWTPNSRSPHNNWCCLW